MKVISVISLKKLIQVVVFIWLLFISTLSFALACNVYFPQGVNGAGNQSEISIEDPSVSLQNQTYIPADDVDLCGSCNANCEGGTNCSIQNEVPTLPNPSNWQSNSSNSDIFVNSGTQYAFNFGVYDRDDVTVTGSGTLVFSSTSPNNIYRLDDIVVDDGLIVLGEGTYYVDTLTIRGNGAVVLAPTGNVKFFVRTSIDISQNGNFNNTDPNTNEAHRLFVYIYGHNEERSEFRNSGKMDAVLYIDREHDQELRIRNSFQFRGAITSENEIEIRNSATITYQPDAVSSIDTGGLCDVSGSLLDHFVINHSTNAVYCLPSVITVSARDSSNQIITDFSDTIVLDTGSGRGTWTLNAGNGVLSDPGSDDGVATYTFVDSDDGVASFNLEYIDGPPDIDIEVYLQANASIRDNDTEGLLRFAPQGFVLTESAVPSNPSGTPTSYNATQTAGISDSIHITAYGQLPFGSCGVIESYAGNKDIKFWMDYTDPNSGQGVVATINNNPIATSEGMAGAEQINFTLGRAAVDTRYRDVGLIKIHAKDDVTGPTTIQGATDNFVVKPAQFAFIAIENLNSVPNPEAANANDGVFTIAGENFTVRLEVQDNDGNLTPNYGNESSPEGILLSSNELIAPAGGRNGSLNNGTINNGSAFNKISNGVFEGTTFQFDEVGIIRLKAEVADQDYLGSGNVITLSNNVGRFIPARLAATRNTPEISPSCTSGGFTYLNAIADTTQNFNYTDNTTLNPRISIEAQAKGDGITGTTTENYTGTFFKLIASDVTATYSSNSPSISPSGAELLNLTTIDNTTDVSVTGGSGLGTISFTHASGFGFEKDATGGNTPNFNAEIQLLANFSDADGVEGIESGDTDITFGGTSAMGGIAFVGSSPDLIYNKIYQGRMVLENIAGSELTGLTMPMRVEYYNGSDFLLNPFEDFSCTQFTNASHINVIDTNPNSISVSVDSVSQGLTPGQWNILLDPPSPLATVEAEIEANLSTTGANLEHLQHDWPYDGIDGQFDDNPQGQASFGISAGDDSLIFMKEIFN